MFDKREAEFDHKTEELLQKGDKSDFLWFPRNIALPCFASSFCSFGFLNIAKELAKKSVDKGFQTLPGDGRSFCPPDLSLHVGSLNASDQPGDEKTKP